METKSFLGLKFSLFNNDELIDSIIKTINQQSQKVIFGYSLTLLPKFKQHPQIYTYSNEFDWFVPDGKGIYMLYRVLGVPLKYHISLPDLTELVLEISNNNNYKVLLLGATKEINNKAVNNLKKVFFKILNKKQ